jgi:hypothetical protein
VNTPELKVKNDTAKMHQSSFVIDETPYCVCEWDLLERNLRFLESVDPTYFKYIAVTQSQALRNEDEKIRQPASLALRMTYSQGLETLFAFIFATIQAPECIAGWLLKYRVVDIVNLLSKIRRRKPILSVLKSERPSWRNIASTIFSYAAKENIDDLTSLFSGVWESLSSDYLSKNFGDEYNNIKHGLRIRTGGFSLAIGSQKQPEIPAKQMYLLGKSNYGSTFFVPEKIGNAKAHFRIKQTSRNWRVERFTIGLELISLSLVNILASLRIQNGVKRETVEFVWPSNPDLFNQFFTVLPSECVSIDYPVDESDISVTEREEILGRYDKAIKIV